MRLFSAAVLCATACGATPYAFADPPRKGATCGDEAFVVDEGEADRALRTREWSTANGWRDAEGQHFVRFALLHRRRVAIEILFAADGTVRRRIYDRFVVKVVDDAWRVSGRPTEERSCVSLALLDQPR